MKSFNIRTIKISESYFLAGVLIIYLFIAYKNSGYHQEDEHYQIIEFANYKLGLLDSQKLAWEFKEQIRPGFQPLLCFLLFKIFSAVGISDVYNLAFLLRAITAMFSTVIIWKFVNSYKTLLFDNLIPYFVFLSFFLWFLPYINVRFSSETWSGMLLLLGLALVLQFKDSHSMGEFFTIGLVFGLSILFRYQSALAIMGVYIWLISIAKIKLKQLVSVSLAIFAVLLMGVLIDYWLYGQFTLTLFNYFYINLIRGVASNFGVNPWYEYLRYIFFSPGPIGILIIIALLILISYDPKNILLWAITPFLVIHSMIPHKELRFLYPIANLVPIILVLAYQIIYHKLKPTLPLRTHKYIPFLLLILLFMINAAGLFAIASGGAGTKRTAVAEYIHRHYNKAKTNIILIGEANPYMTWDPMRNSYYSSQGLHIIKILNIWEKDLSNYKKPGFHNLLVIADNDLIGPRTQMRMRSLGLVRIYQNIPDWVSIINNYYKPELNNLRLAVYEFR
jgi:phosphatidylinositol glycan class B